MQKLTSLFLKAHGAWFRRRHGSVRIDISPSSRINLMRVRPMPDCELKVAANSLLSCEIRYERPAARVEIGERTFVGRSLVVCSQTVTIGADVLISWGVTIVDHDSHNTDFELRRHDVTEWMSGRKDWTHVPSRPVHISDKAWIGFGATILKGVKVGEGAIVAARAVVTSDVPPWTIVAGNPARVIRELRNVKEEA